MGGISLTLIIVAMTAIISYQAFSNRAMKDKLIFHPQTIKNGGASEFYRFLTHGFLHGDMGHLLINMYVLYVFGEMVVVRFMHAAYFGEFNGRIIYLVLYFGAIILSSIPQYFRHQNNGYYRALGASGGTSAIVFAYIIFRPWDWFIFPPLPGVLMAVAYLMYSSYMDKKGGDNIGHNAHFWGAVFGFAFTLVMIMVMAPDMMEVFLGKLLVGPSMPNFN